MSSSRNRISYLDTAKALGIFLVFYGHLSEEFFGLGSQVAYTQYKFIFAFHMPFFFLVAGFFFRQRSLNKITEIRRLFLRRIIPVFFFGVLALLLWPIYQYLISGSADWQKIGELSLTYLKGQPGLNPITWFLVCLFVVEIIALWVLPKITSTLWGLAISGLFLALGLALTYDIKLTEELFGIYKNTWYLHEAIVAFGLYALGYFAFPYLQIPLRWHPLIRLVLLAIFATITFATFQLNNPHYHFVVIMKGSWHGDSLWFLITALSGTLLLLLLASLLPRTRMLDFIGQNTLILLGMNGLFHNFINVHVCTKVGNLESFWAITGVSLAASLISLALSVPAILFLNKYLPQMVGKPAQSGPWLPAFEPR